MLVAALWGFAEATLFFVVPDVWLTWLAARRGVVAGLKVALAAAVAAAVGGALVYVWTEADPVAWRNVYDLLPAISPAMIAEVVSAMARTDWPLAVVEGSLSGVPYKLFAAAAGETGVSLPMFLLASIPARLVRFIVVVLLAATLAHGLRRLGKDAWITPVHLGFWALFYAWFWIAMPA